MHQQFLQQAIELACQNVVANSGGPYGAVIVHDGRVIASSGNRVTHDLDPTAHAEIMTIRAACQFLQDFQLTDCILYASCEPCPMCLGAIYWARLKEVYYASNRLDAAAAGFDDCFIYDELEKHPEQRKIAMRQLTIGNARRPFELWRAQQDKLPY
ncbi:nucleoside deaminase [Methylomarinum sp. Ch1-1]|uniref:Nucleoside deaminase n=1 Tax=Methylomarinum roseum TaxID=3067653 RepID=A0AAU7NV84_9GAMM|nr:nucleoside deaminase [Methylomarinum sp. Ch1-1]MDP4523063.1 nucleoside deaminase [Methylomarinum sp. Ch1-1]